MTPMMSIEAGVVILPVSSRALTMMSGALKSERAIGMTSTDDISTGFRSNFS